MNRLDCLIVVFSFFSVSGIVVALSLASEAYLNTALLFLGLSFLFASYAIDPERVLKKRHDSDNDGSSSALKKRSANFLSSAALIIFAIAFVVTLK